VSEYRLGRGGFWWGDAGPSKQNKHTPTHNSPALHDLLTLAFLLHDGFKDGFGLCGSGVRGGGRMGGHDAGFDTPPFWLSPACPFGLTHRRAPADIAKAHKQDGLGGGHAVGRGRHAERAAVAEWRSRGESPGVAWDDGREEAAQKQAY
jgi:hypothetical protein